MHVKWLLLMHAVCPIGIVLPVAGPVAGGGGGGVGGWVRGGYLAS